MVSSLLIFGGEKKDSATFILSLASYMSDFYLISHCLHGWMCISAPFLVIVSLSGNFRHV